LSMPPTEVKKERREKRERREGKREENRDI
jgi:hypothetical protein